MAGGGGVWHVWARLCCLPQYQVIPSHRITISTTTYTRCSSTMAFPLSYRKTIIDDPFLRLGHYPQTGGTRPGGWIGSGARCRTSSLGLQGVGCQSLTEAIHTTTA